MSPTEGEATPPHMFIEGNDLLEMAKDLRKVIQEASKSNDADKVSFILSEHDLLTTHANLIQMAREGKIPTAPQR